MATATVPGAGIGDYLGALRRRYIYLITILPAVLFICVVAAFGIPPLYQSTRDDHAGTVVRAQGHHRDDRHQLCRPADRDRAEPGHDGARACSTSCTTSIRIRLARTGAQTKRRSGSSTTPRSNGWTRSRSSQRRNRTHSHCITTIPIPKSPRRSTSASRSCSSPTISWCERLAAGEATGFLQKQSEGIAQQMREVDMRIAEVKRKYGEAMPELLLRNQSSVEDYQRQIDALQQQILTAQEKESVLALQLSQMNPNLITAVGRSHRCGHGAGQIDGSRAALHA